MIINGNEIAGEIKASLKERVSKLTRVPSLHIMYAGSDPVIESFMRLKIKTGEEIGVTTIVHRFDESISESDFVSEIQKVASDHETDGMIIQLPLPHSMETQKILNLVPPEKDVDVLSDEAFAQFQNDETKNIPPVAGAFMEILTRHDIALEGKKVVILGRGKLVGKPFTVCMQKARAEIIALNSTTGDPTPHLLTADIIATGIGKPHFIKPEMIHKGVILLDGGTSELDGKIVGDASPECAEKCKIFTPVPRGIGPITVVLLFRNLLNNIIP